MKHLFTSQRTDIQERGAILVFFAIVLVVLLGFVALVVDAGIGESGRGEERTSVQNAALAAMSSYLEVLKTPTPVNNPGIPFATAQAAAKAQGEALLAASNRISKNSRFDPAAQTELSVGNNDGEGVIKFGRMVWALPTPGGTGDSAAAAADRAACTLNGSVKTPCFRPVTNGTEAATAIEVTTQSRDNPIKTIFGRVFGADRYDIGASAIATLIPQNYLFLLDLSPSILDQTYRRFGEFDEVCDPAKIDPAPTICTTSNWFTNPACFKPASAYYFTYEVDIDRAAALDCHAAGQNGECACFSSLINGENCLKFARFAEFGASTIDSDASEETSGSLSSVDFERRRSRRIFGGYGSWWDTANGQSYALNRFPPACPPSPDRSQCPNEADGAVQCQGSWTPSQSSPRSFYRLVYPTLGTDLITRQDRNEDDPAALVDFGQAGDPDNFLSNPEPLKSVLDATNDAMEFIKDRAVSADRFFLTGFDETILSARTTCRNESLEDCAAGETLVEPMSNAFEGFLRLTNVKEGTANNWRSYSIGNSYHFLNRSFFSRQGYNTDIQLTLWKAYEELAANPSASVAKNLVFLITDGIANCKFSDIDQKDALEGNQPFKFDGADLGEYISKRRCDGNLNTIGQTVIESIQQMSTNLINSKYNKTLVQLLQEKSIAVSVILIGKNVQPHYLLRPSTTPGGTSGCLTNSEAVYGGIPFVDWSTSATGSSYLCDGDKDSCTNGFNTEVLTADAQGALINPNGDITLPISNLLYSELVAPTRGAWVPIMPSLSGADADFTAELKAKCNDAYQDEPSLTGEEKSPRIRSFTLDSGTRVSDAQGRLLYDPSGRDQKTQIIDAIKQVLGGGYVLVEPAMRAAN